MTDVLPKLSSLDYVNESIINDWSIDKTSQLFNVINADNASFVNSYSNINFINLIAEKSKFDESFNNINLNNLDIEDCNISNSFNNSIIDKLSVYCVNINNSFNKCKIYKLIIYDKITITDSFNDCEINNIYLQNVKYSNLLKSLNIKNIFVKDELNQWIKLSIID